MEEQPHLVGIGRAARSAIALQLSLVQLDEVLGLATGAVERVLDVFGAASLERGNDEADIEAEQSGLDARDNTAAVGIGDVGPAFYRIAGLGVSIRRRSSIRRASDLRG